MMKHPSLKALGLVVLLGLTCVASLPAQFDGVNEKEMREWADRGDADAQFELGLRLITGEGIRKNEEEGVTWVRRAAEQDHLRAQHVLGSLYEEGVGVSQDLKKAQEWYRKAADLGFALAQFAVGLSYDLGRGVEVDKKEAAEWYRKSAAQGHLPAMAAYASKMELGEGVEKDTAKAALYYLKASQKGYIPAMTRIAGMYYTGTGVPVDYERAGAWYQRAARSDDPWSSNNFAWFLATCPDGEFHHAETSITFAKRALKMLGEAGEEQRYEMLDTMAAALARNGEFLEAVLWQKRAIELLDEDKDIGPDERAMLDKEFQERLKLYKNQKAYSEARKEGEKGTEALPQDVILEEEKLPGTDPHKKPKKGDDKGSVV